MPFFTSPLSLHTRSMMAAFDNITTAGTALPPQTPFITSGMATGIIDVMKEKVPHASHPDFGHLVLLVFEAVLEVVCVSAPGYVVAYMGMFSAENQKFIANLNVQLFTPCLVFSKLASQLTVDKLKELWVIPVIFVAMTLVSWLGALMASKLCRFEKRQKNFVIAMAVFGNSNSLPISLVISLSKTISGLHWDQVLHDNDNEVAARGILYLLIFQQLGQLLRWSWGYNVLLKPPTEEEERLEEGRDDEDLLGEERYRDDDEEDHNQSTAVKIYSSDYASGSSGPHSPETISSVASSTSSLHERRATGEVMPTPANGNVVGAGPGNMTGREAQSDGSTNHITQFPSYNSLSQPSSEGSSSGLKGYLNRTKHAVAWCLFWAYSITTTFLNNLFRRLPIPIQKFLSISSSYVFRFLNAIWQSMNPPLWAMLIAVIVASVPTLQHLFFTKGTFINNSVTSAVQQSGSVAVPLILVVLGGNLARNTLPRDDMPTTAEEKKAETRLLYAALVSRMLIPTLILAPMLAVFAKFVPVSILDDPIFIIVCFLLIGAPTALQLAQICQLNNVFMPVMSRLLFLSYVVVILPSTLVLVMVALEVVEWAT